MKIGIILGTRPEIIKLSSIIRLLQNQNNIEWFIIHTNQHYSENMDKIFFDELELSQPKYNLGINGGNHGEMTGRMMIYIEQILIKEKPDVILVQGDTNTVLSGGLSASKLGIKVGHVEAGLRSYDRTMPEEINRVVIDHLADYLFVPTDKQKQILIGEGVDDKKIYVTGNTIVDAVYECIKISNKKNDVVLNKYGIKDDGYILVTSHRPSNVDNSGSLKDLLKSIIEIKKISNKKIIFPIHPRTRNNINKFGLNDLLNEFIVTEPIGFLDNLVLENNSFMIMTDSGGIQEEACILRKKTLVLRDNTERPETVEVGGAILVGNNKEKIIKSFEQLINKEINWYNPFGDGNTGKIIIDIITK